MKAKIKIQNKEWKISIYMKVITIFIKKKIYPAEARNIGVKFSNKNSSFISFCDSDDIIKPEKTKIQIDIMLKENLEASCTNVDFFNVIVIAALSR